MFSKIYAIVTVLSTVAALAMYSAPASAQRVEGLVSYWSFDDVGKGDVVKDEVGGNDGELMGFVEVVDGKFGDAVEFNGAFGTCVMIAHDLSLALPDALTLIAWVYPEQKQDVYVMGKSVSAPAANYAWVYQYPHDADAGIEETIWGGGSIAPWPQAWVGTAEGTVPVETWTHIAMTIDSEWGIKHYVNGEFSASLEIVGKMTTDEAPVTIGSKANCGVNFLGIIDEAGVYSRALSDDEINLIFRTHALAVSPQGKMATIWARIKNG